MKLVACLAASAAFCVATSGAVATNTTVARTRAVVLFLGDSNVSVSAEAIDWALTGQPSLGLQPHKNNGYIPVLASRSGSGIRTADCPDEATCTTYDYWKLKLETFQQKIVPDAIVADLGINDSM